MRGVPKVWERPSPATGMVLEDKHFLGLRVHPQTLLGKCVGCWGFKKQRTETLSAILNVCGILLSHQRGVVIKQELPLFSGERQLLIAGASSTSVKLSQ